MMRTRLALEIAGVGLAGGIVGDLLMRAMPPGLNVTISVAALVAAGAWMVRRHNLKTGPDTAWLAISAVLLGIAVLRRDAEALAVLDMMTLVMMFALLAASMRDEVVSEWSAVDYVRGLVTAAFGSVTGAVMLVARDIPWQQLPHEGRMRHVRAGLLGVLIALPLLVVFGGLFAAADQVFNTVLTDFFAINVEAVFQHTFQIVFWTALVAGLLRWGLLTRPAPRSNAAPAVPTIVPIATALGLLDALFLVFVVVQLRYFFGGATLIATTSGLTYAQYAREGFFQLVTASALVLPVVLGADYLVRGGTPAQLRIFRWLAGLLLALLSVVMVSALQRMRLYVAEFGLSEDRLYATAFMLLLIGVFAWFAGTILRGVRRRFAFGALMQAFAVLAGLHSLNPSAFVVRHNLDRPTDARPFDARYATTLGADAVPALVEALPRLDSNDRCLVITRLLDRWVDGERAQTDWRTWNWSRSRARAVLSARAVELRESCRDWKES